MFGLVPSLFDRSPAKWLGLFALFISGSLLMANSYARDGWIDLVRTEDGEFSREIVYQLHDGDWQAPVFLTKGSRLDAFTPVTMRTDNNRALIVWKESTGVDASNLLFCFIDFDLNGNVSAVSGIHTIETGTAHQSSPTLIRGLDSKIRGFWVGFNGRDDDIYYAEFEQDAWSQEKRLYQAENNVPDLRPTARLNVNGAVELRWRQFSYDKGAYIDVFSALDKGNADNLMKWSLPEKYVLNPLEKIPRLPDRFSLPDDVTYPDSVAINHSANPGIALHWNALRNRNETTGISSGNPE